MYLCRGRFAKNFIRTLTWLGWWCYYKCCRRNQLKVGLFLLFLGTLEVGNEGVCGRIRVPVAASIVGFTSAISKHFGGGSTAALWCLSLLRAKKFARTPGSSFSLLTLTHSRYIYIYVSFLKTQTTSLFSRYTNIANASFRSSSATSHVLTMLSNFVAALV